MSNITLDNIYMSKKIADDFYSEKYPLGLDLKPTSETSLEIANLIRRLANDSHAHMSQRYSTWHAIDHNLTSYIDIDALEQKRRGKDNRKPVSIVIPVSYSALDTMLTHFASAFFSEDLFKFRPSGPEDKQGAMLLELVCNKQARDNNMFSNLYTQFRDNTAYGFGVSILDWEQRFEYKTEVTREQTVSAIDNKTVMNDITERTQSRKKVYEGNVLMNIASYNCLFDPTMPFKEVQRARYFAWYDETNYIELLESERDNDSMFNVRFLNGINANRGGMAAKYHTNAHNSPKKITKSKDTLKILNIFIKLIPGDYGIEEIDEPSMPRKFFIRVAEDHTIIHFEMLEDDHDRFPITIMASEDDGYSVNPTSKLELIGGIQHVVNWYMNSHIDNIQQAIRNRFIVDPSIVNIHSLAGNGNIYLQENVWNKNVKDGIQQLAVQDVTKNHVGDMQLLIALIQQLLGIDMLTSIRRRTSERVSAAEANNDISSFSGRMSKTMKLISMQAIHPLSYMVASQTIQYMEDDIYAAIVGRNAEDLMTMFEGANDGTLVSAGSIDINYDIDTQATMSFGGEDTQGLMLAFQSVMGSPQLGARFDVVRLFTYLAKTLGFNNIKDFEIKVQPDQVVQDQFLNGSLQPIQNLGG